MNIRIKIAGALILCMLQSFAGYAANAIEFGDKSSSIKIVGASSKMKIVPSPLIIDNGSVFECNGGSVLGNFVFLNANCLDLTEGTSPGGIIYLTGNDSFFGDPNEVNAGVIASNQSNRLSGFVRLTGPICLQDLNTTLTIALVNTLNQNIKLRNGNVILENNLGFADDFKFTGSGTVTLNGYRTTFGGAPLSWPDQILWNSANDLVLNSRMTVTGIWYFAGASRITGNGNLVDLTSGGSIWIKSGATLSLADIKVKGLGSGRIVFEDDTSMLRLSQAEVEMDGNITWTTGGVYIEGPTTIVTQNKTLTLSDLASMTVDGLALEYDTLDFGNENSIMPIPAADPNQKFIAYENNGIIRKIVSGRVLTTFSNALLYLTKNNSNALLACCKNASNTILYLTKNNSNALLAGDKNNSNTLLYLDKNNSNALLACCKNASNTILYLVKNLSNALLAGDKNNSNTLLYLDKNNSNALLACCKNASNTTLYLVKNLSNALLAGDKNNSNTLLYLNSNNSNTLLYINKNNSNAIVWLDAQLDTIDHGPWGVVIDTAPTYTLSFDIFLSSSHNLLVTVDTTINGSGHAIKFARKQFNQFRIQPGVVVTLENVILRDFDDEAITLMSPSSQIIFGNCTKVELSECQDLTKTWTFIGETLLYGDGNVLNFVDQKIRLLQPGHLTIQELALANLRNSNLGCVGPDAHLIFKSSTLHLSSDFIFPVGSMRFVEENIITGTTAFIYTSTGYSMVNGNAMLVLDKGLTFSYAPASADRDLIALQNDTSKIFFDGCSVVSSLTGMRLTRGVLCVSHNNFLHNTGAVSASQGFAFGNGSSALDLDIQIMPGASLEVVSGLLDYANVDA